METLKARMDKNRLTQRVEPIEPVESVEPMVIEELKPVEPSIETEDDFTPFAHLHVHTGYSELDSAAMPKDLAKEAAKNKMLYLAVTDHGNLSAWPEFRAACEKEKIKPIYGCEFYMNDSHLVALAETQEGIGNIIALSTRGYLEGFDRKPRINKLMLKEHSQGIILLSACIAGEIPKRLLADDIEGAAEIVKTYQEIVGPQNLFLEVQDHGLPEEKKVIQMMPTLSQMTGTRIVATNDVHYLKRDNVVVQDLLYTIRNGRDSKGCPNCHFRTYEEMEQLFPITYLTTAFEIAERCSKVELTNPSIPERVPRSGIEDLEGFIVKECMSNMQMLYSPEHYSAVKERFEYELSVYKEMSMLDYAYIVYDIIRFARENGIYVGPGRGSAAGSIVMYLLRVTDIEPLSNGLLFERFLAPGRVSMPDVDMDFDSDRREEVINYLRQKYGEANTCRIIEFSKFGPRSAFQDAARTLGIQPSLTTEFSKTLDPSTPGLYIDEKKAKALLVSHPILEKAQEISNTILKLPRHHSVHACGFAISPKPLLKLVPLSKVGDAIVTQWEGSKVEDFLVKMDLLGLKNLATIRQTNEMNPESQNIVYGDPEVFQMLSEGKTVGVFQFESQGMIDTLKNFKPTKQEHITALVAMYRPGPMGEIPGMIDRKFGRKPIELIDPRMEPILQETYGTIVYQEQVMEITKQLAGFTPSEADKFRKGMGKKKPEIIAELKPKFYKGCINGMTQKQVDDLWALMERFAEYGFNKSHAAAYAEIAYQTAYLANKYPLEYFSAYLNGYLGKYDQLSSHIYMIRKQIGIEILPPSVNDVAGLGFAPSADRSGIRYGIRGIKGLRMDIIERIVHYSPFKDYHDFAFKMGKLLTPKIRSLLVNSGALECLGKPVKNPMAQFNAIGLFFGETGLEDFKNIGSNRYQGVGILLEIKNMKTKKGDPMAILNVLTNTETRTVMSFKETVPMITDGKNKRFLLTANPSNRDEDEFILVKAELLDEDIQEEEQQPQVIMGSLF